MFEVMTSAIDVVVIVISMQIVMMVMTETTPPIAGQRG